MKFLITGALNIPSITPIIKAQREIEYIYSLSKLFHYDIPIDIVVSECTEEQFKDSFFNNFKYDYSLCIKDTLELGAKTKSQKEYVSIQQYILNSDVYDDDKWVIKMSGRYLFIDDKFFNTVNSLSNSSECNAVIKLCDNNTQVYTFCFAMKWKYFKLLYSNHFSILGDKNVEKYVLEFIKENIISTTLIIDMLGLVTNINNDNVYTIY